MYDHLRSRTDVQTDDVTRLSYESPPASPPEQFGALPSAATPRFKPHLYSISALDGASVMTGSASPGLASDGALVRVGGSPVAPAALTSPDFEKTIARAILVRAVMILSRACDNFLKLRQDVAREVARASSDQLGGRAGASSSGCSLDTVAWMQLFELGAVLSFWRDWATGWLGDADMSELKMYQREEAQSQTDAAYGIEAYTRVLPPALTHDEHAAYAASAGRLEEAVFLEEGVLPGECKGAPDGRPRAPPPSRSEASQLEEGDQQAVGEALPGSLVSCLRLCVLWWVGAKSESRPRVSRCALALEQGGGRRVAVGIRVPHRLSA